MPHYTFYPCAADGSSATFVGFELQDDMEAQSRARTVLDENKDCSHVIIWAGDRKVLTRYRVHADLRAMLGASKPTGTAGRP